MDKSRVMMIVIITLLVLLLLVVVGVGIWLMRLPGTEAEGWDKPQPPMTTHVLTPKDLDIFTFESITTNLALGSNGRSNHIVATMVVGLNAHESVDLTEREDFTAVFERGIPVARSVALDVFGALTFEDIRSNEGRAAAAEMIKTNLQQTFDSNLIVYVSFSDWNLVEGR